MSSLSVTIKPVSGACNMRCGYCGYTKGPAAGGTICRDEMTEKTQEQVIRRILEFADGQCSILFQGGEPTLAGIDFYRKWLAYEALYNKRGVKILHAFQTNGYALDEEWCDFLAENHFLTEISIDGIPSTHNYYRRDKNGEGTYFRVMESAERLQKAGADFNVLTVVNRRTASSIWKIYAKYRKMGFRSQQYTVCLDPAGEALGETEYSLTPKLYGRFLIELFELWMADLQSGCQPHIRQFENYIGILMGIEPGPCEQRGICGMQTVVESDGCVYPCDFCAADRCCLGNLNRDSLETIQERQSGLRSAQRTISRDPECAVCRYADLCRGGCRRHKEIQPDGTGKNRFCESYRMFFDACLPRMTKAALAAARQAQAQRGIG